MIRVRYAFEKATQNYNVYRELSPKGEPMPDGLPKDQYALNCRPTQYIPKGGTAQLLGNNIVITIENE